VNNVGIKLGCPLGEDVTRQLTELFEVRFEVFTPVKIKVDLYKTRNYKSIRVCRYKYCDFPRQIFLRMCSFHTRLVRDDMML